MLPSNPTALFSPRCKSFIHQPGSLFLRALSFLHSSSANDSTYSNGIFSGWQLILLASPGPCASQGSQEKNTISPRVGRSWNVTKDPSWICESCLACLRLFPTFQNPLQHWLRGQRLGQTSGKGCAKDSGIIFLKADGRLPLWSRQATKYWACLGKSCSSPCTKSACL